MTPRHPALPPLLRAPLLLAALLLPSACSSSGDTKEPSPTAAVPAYGYLSGSRLRAHLFDGGQGAKQFQGWRDTKLGVDCRFQQHADGSARCLPTGSQIAFADDACQKPVVLASSAAADPCQPSDAPAYFLFYPPSLACAYAGSAPFEESPARVYRKGASLDAVTVHHLDQAGSCTTDTSDPQAAFEAVEVEAAQLAGGTIHDEHLYDRISAQVIHGDDGSRETLALADEALGEPCLDWLAHHENSAYSNRCVTGRVVVGETEYADASCQEPAPSQSGGEPFESCPPPQRSVSFGHPPCAEELVTVFDFGAPVPAGTDYCGAPGGTCAVCSTSSPPDPRRAVTVVPPSHFPVLRSALFGDGDLRVDQLVDGEKHPILTREVDLFQDAKRKTRCGPIHAGDTWRCASVTAPSIAGYRDAACTKPFFFDDSASGCAPAPAPLPAVLYDSCYKASALHAVTAGPPAGHAYVLQGTTCVAATFSGDMTAYDLGDDVTGTFPELKDVIE